MVDRLQDVISRGCSANCKGRNFIWTDEYQVYCCNDRNKCNIATDFRVSFIAIVTATVVSLLCVLTLSWIFRVVTVTFRCSFLPLLPWRLGCEWWKRYCKLLVKIFSEYLVRKWTKRQCQQLN